MSGEVTFDGPDAALYARFAERLVHRGLVTDPWLGGQPRFREEPEVVSATELLELASVAEDAAALHDEACRLCAREPALLREFLGLTPYQEAMWLASAPAWHGIARADVFRTERGFVACELNSDTPTGEAEAVELSRLALEDAPSMRDPNALLGARFGEMVEAVCRSALAEPAALRTPGLRNAALVYPTEMPEDLPLVRVYREWLCARGWNVVLGSPFNLTRGRRGEVRLFDVPCPLVVRHYKTDWWGERAPIWRDEEGPLDAQPLSEPLAVLLDASLTGRVAVINPFGAVLAQNKRLLALCFERQDRLPAWARAALHERFPETLRRESVHDAELFARQEEWVLKSDYGCEGEEVIIGRAVSAQVWRECLELAAPGRFVVQRYFDALPSRSGDIINHGVYVVAGQAAGLYGRASRGRTDTSARSIPMLVECR